MGEDKDNQLPKAKKLALKYMPSDSEIEISKGDYGQVMTVVSSITLGFLSKFEESNPFLLPTLVGRSKVFLRC